jgi:hypothetical protein
LKLRLGVVDVRVQLPKHVLPHEYSIAMPPQFLPGGIELKKLD